MRVCLVIKLVFFKEFGMCANVCKSKHVEARGNLQQLVLSFHHGSKPLDLPSQLAHHFHILNYKKKYPLISCFRCISFKHLGDIVGK